MRLEYRESSLMVIGPTHYCSHSIPYELAVVGTEFKLRSTVFNELCIYTFTPLFIFSLSFFKSKIKLPIPKR